jgi:arylsulfatase A-like enzyme
MLTGKYGSHNGVLGLGSQLNETEKLLPQYLKKAGYITGLSGKWHIGQTPENFDFDFLSYFKGNGTYYGRQVIDQGDTIFPKIHIDDYGVMRSIDFLKKHANKDTPFMLLHCPQTPHMNHQLIWDAKDSTKQTYNIEQMPVPQNRLDNLDNKPEYLKTVRNRLQAMKYGYPDSIAIQKHTRDYYAVITELDSFLGKLFAEVDKLGLKENTFIIFMSDNGWMLGDHGFTSKVLPYRTSMHVPFWITGPGISARHEDAIVSNLDITPTILDLAGLPVPEELHGKSLMPVISGIQSSVRDYFIYEGLGSYGGSAYNLTVVTSRYSYIVTYKSRKMKEVVFRELYDYFNDPMEMNNLAITQPNNQILHKFDKYIEKYKTNLK